MANQNYGEVLCQAVDEIVRKRLEGVVYDSTILCTIVDNSRKDEGIYTVSNNGSTKFEAYSSDTSYRVNDNVYVQIPGGDWNQQKIILAKKKDKTEEPFIYESPFDSLVDITGNLIDIGLNQKVGLVANGTVIEQSIWNWVASDLNPPLTAYSRLGISGSFQSWLNPFYDEAGNATEVKYGDYGYRLDITTTNEDISTDNAAEGKYSLYLSCADMIGNPYNFQSYYHQEKVFDISQIGKIKQMSLYFYQDAGSFRDAAGTPISAEDFLGNPIAPNLFTIDPYITLGYDIREFDEEMVTIYALQSTTYSRTSTEDYNKKNIYLRWIHINEDGKFESINDESKLDYEIRWYRYELGHKSADEYSGVYWKNYARQIQSGSSSIYSSWDETKESWNTDQYNTTFFKTTINPDVTLQEEKIKAIIIYNNKPYRSNILTLVNEDEVVSKPTVDAVQALSIVCEDESYGNYRIYGQNGSLLDMSKRNDERIWTPYFKSSLGGQDVEPTILTEAESIEWIIPTERTMIELDPEFYDDADDVTTESGTGRIHIKRYCNASGSVANVNTQSYKIRSYYSQSYSDNTIQCKIVKEKITYTATKELTFGVAGTTGTDYTFILDFDNGVTAVTMGSNKKVSVTARLYDYENNEIDISNRDIDWGWKESDGVIKLLANGSSTVELQSNSSSISASYNILQADMKWGDWTLTAYLPIPIRRDTQYAYISGTTQVIYNSAGEILDCARNPYILYSSSGTIQQVSQWQCYGEGDYAPTLKTSTDKNGYTTSYLVPLSFYVEGANEEVCVIARVGGAIVWSQPILILQNRYPSAMLNRWDGSLDVGVTDPGTILAPRFAAGRKNAIDNTFSGVVLGDWTPTNSSSELTAGTGLFGYNAGEQSYGFRDDGTAFIGKSGAGRLLFNGNESTITSNRYAQNLGGMELDFDDGSIELIAPYGVDSIYQNKTISLDAAAKVTPFNIGSNFSVDWDGTMSATNGDFSGYITAIGGKITGELDVSSGKLKGGSIIGSYIANAETSPTFAVNSLGYMTAASGKIGNWSISDGAISNGGTTLSSDGGLNTNSATITGGSLRIGCIDKDNDLYNFKVDEDGNAIVQGTIYASQGSIGGWHIYEGKGPVTYYEYSKDFKRYILYNMGETTISARADGWKSLFAYQIVNGEKKWTVLDPLRDNVLAIQIPNRFVFNENSQGHNTARFRITNQGDIYLGTDVKQVNSLTYLKQPLILHNDGSIDAGGTFDENTNQNNYSVKIDGTGLTATKGNIASWNIGTKSLWSGGTETNPTLYYGTTGISATVAGESRTNLIFKAGSGFGVDSSGKVYANTGTLGGWTIDANGLKNSASTAVLTPTQFKLGNFKVTSDGAISIGNETSPDFSVSKNGSMTAVSGSIGSWLIANKTIASNVSYVKVDPYEDTGILLDNRGTYPKLVLRNNGSIELRDKSDLLIGEGSQIYLQTYAYTAPTGYIPIVTDVTVTDGKVSATKERLQVYNGFVVGRA